MSSHDETSNGAAETGSTHEQETPQLSRVQQKLQEVLSGAKKIDLSYLYDEEEEAREIGEAIASSQTLEELTLQLDSMTEWEGNTPGPYEIILTTAFLGNRPNTSVHSLIVQGSGTDGDTMKLGALSPVIRENSNLSKLEIRWSSNDGSTRRQTREFFNSLLQNSTLHTLVLPRFADSEDEGFIDAETFSQIVRLVEENKSIHHLELFIGECRGPGSEDLNLPGFYAALKSNSTIKTLELRGNFLTQDAESDYLEWIEGTNSLKELHLDSIEEYYDEDDDDVPIRIFLFFKSLRNNKSLKKLVADGTIVEEEETFQELMDAIRGDLTLPSLQLVFEHQNDGEDSVQEQSQATTTPEDPYPVSGDGEDAVQEQSQATTSPEDAVQEQSQATTTPEDPYPASWFLRCWYLPIRYGFCRCFCFICYC
ncbi:hypothetical protein R1sor_005394 [Riccia sorocarpa]|uniref:Uncharacterized protein n=1 Tax=Riccia sorocarpa TaxID=122646 RepID=A0ABD3HJE5_9MARC